MSVRRRAIFGSSSNKDRWWRLAAPPPPRITKKRAATRRPIGIEASPGMRHVMPPDSPPTKRSLACTDIRPAPSPNTTRARCRRGIETIGAKRRTGSLTRQRSRPPLAGVARDSATSRLLVQHIATRVAHRIPLIRMKGDPSHTQAATAQNRACLSPDPGISGSPRASPNASNGRLHLRSCCRWTGNASAAMTRARGAGLLKSAAKRTLLFHPEIDFL